MFRTFRVQKRINDEMPTTPVDKKRGRVEIAALTEAPSREFEKSPSKVDLKVLLVLRTDYISATGVATSLLRMIRGTKTMKPDPSWDWANNAFQLTPLQEALHDCQQYLGGDQFAANLVTSDATSLKKNTSDADIEVI